MRNEEKIIDNQSSVLLLSRDVDDLQEDVEENSAIITKVVEDVTMIQGDVAAVQDDVIAVEGDVWRNSADISTLATTGTWCGYQDVWNKVGTINYNSITFSASNNLNIAVTPLDINTGNYSHKCYYYLDIDIFIFIDIY